jgi:hypothetical protein
MKVSVENREFTIIVEEEPEGRGFSGQVEVSNTDLMEKYSVHRKNMKMHGKYNVNKNKKNLKNRVKKRTERDTPKVNLHSVEVQTKVGVGVAVIMTMEGETQREMQTFQNVKM